MSKNVPIVAVVGRTNVGKSSLFNAILRRREAVVAREPGTTRDSITAKASFEGKDFWLVDTAGMKDAEDDFELTIQEQISQAIDSADVIVLVIENGLIITDEDRRIAKLALKSRKPVVLAVNKADKAGLKDVDHARLGIKPIIYTSATQNRGIKDLLAAVSEHTTRATIHEADDRLHVALLGRPNVGKSYLFNTLAKKQQAIVADKAGTTRDVNRVIVRYEGREIELMDTAGIRRSGKVETGIEQFSVIRSLAAIEQADVCLLLMDVNELNVALDQKIAGLIKEAGKGLILVVSKWDAAPDKTAFTRDQIAPQIKQTYDFIPWAPLIFTSAETGQNVTKIFDLVLSIDKARHQTVKTTLLNRWLQTVIHKHPPAGLKNTQPKLNYMVQETDQSTPSFKIFGSQLKTLHWSYRRYLEREFREAFGFAGTAIKFWFINKPAPDPKTDKK